MSKDRTREELRQRIIDEMNSRRIDHKTYIDSDWLLSEYDKSFHQELQKARYNWLREEIVNLEGIMPKGLSVIIEKGSEFTTPRMYRELGYARAIEELISRYQSELDQPTELQNCIECGEPVAEYESVKNCHSHCRLEI